MTKILLIEDSSINQDAFQSIFGDEYDVTFCSGLHELHALNDIEQYSFAVTDFHLEDGTGLDVANFLRQNQFQSNIFVWTGDESILAAGVNLNSGEQLPVIMKHDLDRLLKMTSNE